ncbi:lipoate--protein ligase family protein [Candidatus Woesearchaeota archaeon]|nr:lipoate--protein ligase family protein [Candidatus Woesearchaeota archaeon]
MQCRFIDTGFNDAFKNMAIDEALLSYCKIPILRVYGWKPAAISVGYSQDIEKEINLEYCRKNNIAIVRRLTGGKAIFHDKEITYSFILPENSNLIPFEVNESYRVIASALKIALEKIGVKAEMKKAPEKIKTPMCFNSSNWYELAVSNKKISGSAQRRFNKKVLQHGSLLLNFDYEKNSSLFVLNKNDKISFENMKQKITSLKNETGRNIGYKELGNTLKQGFKETFNFDILEGNLTDKEIGLAEKLKKEKYSRREWNFEAQIKVIEN